MTNKIEINYALQVCDVASFQGHKRFCGDDRTLLSKKSIKSFLQAVTYLSDTEKNTHHYIRIFEDNCSNELLEFISNCIKKFSTENIKIDLVSLHGKGISNSIKSCYDWLISAGKNLVYQVQDDYLFTEKSIYYSVDMFYQLYYNYKTQPIICPYNYPEFINIYKGKSVPRLLEFGKHGYWMQIYDTSCTFLTSHYQFKQHVDLYDKFYELLDEKNTVGKITDLENKSLNYMFTQRGILGVTSINGLTFHMQSESEKDPYIDWKPIWDSIEIE
jgi:hypothetical protein